MIKKGPPSRTLRSTTRMPPRSFCATASMRATSFVISKWRSSVPFASQAGTIQGNHFSTTRKAVAIALENRPSYNPALAERMNTLLDLASGADLQDAPAALQDAIESARSGGMTFPYQVGRDSYYRVIAYAEAVFGDSADEASLRSLLEAYVHIGDWDLLYSQNGVAFDQYTRVHELLKTTGSGEPLIAESLRHRSRSSCRPSNRTCSRRRNLLDTST